MSDKIKQQLEQLEELYAQQDLINLHKQDAIDVVLSPAVKEELRAIDIEFEQRVTAVGEKIGIAEALIKSGILVEGMTVEGQRFMAIYNKGRISWDTKALDGYAAAHPEIEKFRKQGEPFVSIKKA